MYMYMYMHMLYMYSICIIYTCMKMMKDMREVNFVTFIDWNLREEVSWKQALQEGHFGICISFALQWPKPLHWVFLVQEAAREQQASRTATCEKSSSLTEEELAAAKQAFAGGIITKRIHVVLQSSSLTISIIIICDPGRRGSCKTERGSWECKQRRYRANSSWTYLLEDTWRTSVVCVDYSDGWDRKRKLLQERSRLGSAMHMSSC